MDSWPFHRKAGLYPDRRPFSALQRLLLNCAPGCYDEMPRKGRGHKGTAIRVWRRHVGIDKRLERRREIFALWDVAIDRVLGDYACFFEFVRVEHMAYIIYYCVRVYEGPRPPLRYVDGDLTDDEATYILEAQRGYHDGDFDWGRGDVFQTAHLTYDCGDS